MINENAREVRTPLVIRGTGVGRGIAIGPLKFGSFRGESRRLRMVQEVEKLKTASETVKEELSSMEARAVKSVGDEHGEIYRMLKSELDGGDFLEAVKSFIENGETLSNACDEAVRLLSELAEEGGDRNKKALATRSRELSELLKNAAECISREVSICEPDVTKEEKETLENKKYILVASDVDSFLSSLDSYSDIVGIVSVGGSAGSGLAAYAKIKGIPALVISPEDAPSTKFAGAGAIIDPEKGRLTVNPDLAALDKFTESAKEAEKTEERLASLIGLPSVTRSGRHVALLSTVRGKDDVARAVSYDAEGIGLYIPPTWRDGEENEEKRLEEYRHALESFAGKPTVIGLFSDRDKKGLFGVRFFLEHRARLKSELRAVLRAAAFGELTLAVSGVVSPEELRRVKAVMVETALELKGDGVPFGDKIRIGVIIDTPAAAMCAELLSAEAEIFIADSDSLSALALGLDVKDPSSAELLKRNSEPTLRIIEEAAKAIHSSGKGRLVGVVGDLVTDPSLTERFVGMGVDFLSVPPPYILEVRERIRECP